MENWTEEALCRGKPLEVFFEAYEENKDVAIAVDDMCLGCPVRSQCLKLGVNTSGTGVFGGTYLVLGKFSKTRNSHKLPYVSGKLQEEINDIKKS